VVRSKRRYRCPIMKTARSFFLLALCFPLWSCDKTKCAVPPDPANIAPTACGTGEVWIYSPMAEFNPFCGRLCTTSIDCPSEWACVAGNIAANRLDAVCVSGQVPTPLCGSAAITLEGLDSTCYDDQTLGTKYINNRTGFAGFALTPCPNGCQGGGPDGGVWGLTPGSCR